MMIAQEIGLGCKCVIEKDMTYLRHNIIVLMPTGDTYKLGLRELVPAEIKQAVWELMEIICDNYECPDL